MRIYTFCSATGEKICAVNLDRETTFLTLVTGAVFAMTGAFITAGAAITPLDKMLKYALGEPRCALPW